LNYFVNWILKFTNGKMCSSDIGIDHFHRLIHWIETENRSSPQSTHDVYLLLLWKFVLSTDFG
jgi:hypothetical protein